VEDHAEKHEYSMPYEAPVAQEIGGWAITSWKLAFKVGPLVRNWSGPLYPPQLDLKSPQVTSHPTLEPTEPAARAQKWRPGPSRAATGPRRQSALVVPREGSTDMCGASLHNGQERGAAISSGVPSPRTLFTVLKVCYFFLLIKN